MTNNKKPQKRYKKKGIQEDVRELIIERIKAASGDLGISVGSEGYMKAKI